MKGATPEMEAEWSDEFAQCFVVAFMWADDQREAAAAVVREFIDGGKPVFSTPLRGKRLGWAKWSSLRMLVLERDGYECAYCGSLALAALYLTVDGLTDHVEAVLVRL